MAKENPFKKLFKGLGVAMFMESFYTIRDTIVKDAKHLMDVALKKTVVAVISLIGIVFIFYGIIKIIFELLPPLPAGVDWLVVGLGFILLALLVRLMEK